MPTYEYQCQVCGKTTEARQKFSDKPLTECGCGGNLKRLFGKGGVVFRGGGFYSVDSRPPEN